MKTPNYKSTLRACYLGYVTQALVVNLPPLLFVIFSDKLGLSFAMLGNLVLLIFATQFTVDALSVKFIDKLGYRLSALLAHSFAAAGMIALAVLPNIMQNPYAGLVISAVLFSIGGGLIEVIVSPVVESLPSDAKAESMSLLHSFYSWGQVLVIILSTVALMLVGDDLWYLIPVLWSILPLITLYMFSKVPLAPIRAEDSRVPIKTLVTSKTFIIAMLLMTCSGAAEQAMAQWASLFTEKGLGIDKTLGDLFGPCLFAVMMGITRTAYGVKGAKIDMRKTLAVCSALCVISFGITSLVPYPAFALAGCSLCGLSVGLMWPGMLSLTAEEHPTGGASMFALLALGGDIGCSVGPWLTGAVADISDLNTGLMTAAVFPIVMLAGLLVLGRLIKTKRKQL